VAGAKPRQMTPEPEQDSRTLQHCQVCLSILSISARDPTHRSYSSFGSDRPRGEVDPGLFVKICHGFASKHVSGLFWWRVSALCCLFYLAQ